MVLSVLAIRPQTAAELGRYLSATPNVILPSGRHLLPAEYDLMIGDWCSLRQRKICASIPSFVQHIGIESALSARATCHTFPSWPGREWSYR